MWTCPSCMAMASPPARDLPEARRGGACRGSLAARAQELNRHSPDTRRFREKDPRLADRARLCAGEKGGPGRGAANRMTAMACAALGVSRATVQRRRAVLAAPAAVRPPRARPARAGKAL